MHLFRQGARVNGRILELKELLEVPLSGLCIATFTASKFAHTFAENFAAVLPETTAIKRKPEQGTLSRFRENHGYAIFAIWLSQPLFIFYFLFCLR